MPNSPGPKALATAMAEAATPKNAPKDAAPNSRGAIHGESVVRFPMVRPKHTLVSIRPAGLDVAAMAARDAAATSSTPQVVHRRSTRSANLASAIRPTNAANAAADTAI